MTQMLRYALVLTADPRKRAVSQAHTAAALGVLDAAVDLSTVQVSEPSPGAAWRAIFACADPATAGEIRRTLAQVLSNQPIDVNVVSADPAVMRKRLLVADMESTVIEQEMLDELGDLIGKREVIEDITVRAMRGELEFEAALEERVALLAGLDASVLNSVSERITVMPGARELVATVKAHGGWCALVSGGFSVFTERVARLIGFDMHQANTLEIADGKITGRVMKPILGRKAKLEALERLARAHDIDMAQTLTVGDGDNDMAMLAEASLGVAFRAKPRVREAALANPSGAVVTHGDLTALLYLQGYDAGGRMTAA